MTNLPRFLRRKALIRSALGLADDDNAPLLTLWCLRLLLRLGGYREVRRIDYLDDSTLQLLGLDLEATSEETSESDPERLRRLLSERLVALEPTSPQPFGVLAASISRFASTTCTPNRPGGCSVRCYGRRGRRPSSAHIWRLRLATLGGLIPGNFATVPTTRPPSPRCYRAVRGAGARAGGTLEQFRSRYRLLCKPLNGRDPRPWRNSRPFSKRRGKLPCIAVTF